MISGFIRLGTWKLNNARIDKSCYTVDPHEMSESRPAPGFEMFVAEHLILQPHEKAC